MMASPIRSLGEIALQVSDMDAMVAFYRDVVGLQLYRRFPGSGPAFFRIADGVDGHTQVLALFDRGTRPELAARRPPLDHIAFSVGLPDLALEQRRLEVLGVPIREQTHAWVQWRSLYVEDPEGNVVEWVAFDPSVEQEEW
jgi:catechol 2,3-dioxygenase